MPKNDTLKDILEETHRALAAELLRRVRSGEATSADLSVVRAFLKDNNIDSAPQPGDPVVDLARHVPFAVDENDPLR